MLFFHLQFHGAPLWYMDHLADCNLVFTILFTIECAMKLTSFGPKVNIKRCQGLIQYTMVIRYWYIYHNSWLFYRHTSRIRGILLISLPSLEVSLMPLVSWVISDSSVCSEPPGSSNCWEEVSVFVSCYLRLYNLSR